MVTHERHHGVERIRDDDDAREPARMYSRHAALDR